MTTPFEIVVASIDHVIDNRASAYNIDGEIVNELKKYATQVVREKFTMTDETMRLYYMLIGRRLGERIIPKLQNGKEFELSFTDDVSRCILGKTVGISDDLVDILNI